MNVMVNDVMRTVRFDMVTCDESMDQCMVDCGIYRNGVVNKCGTEWIVVSMVTS